MNLPVGLIALLVAGDLAGPALAQVGTPPDGRPMPTESGILLGAYDPTGDFTNDANVSIEHLFLPWQDVDVTTLAAADVYARDRGRTILATVEPWSWSEDKRPAADALFRGIMEGAYDANTSAICGEIGKFHTATTLRWAQEMEDTTGRFSWAGWAPADYIAAYRKFVVDCRALAPNATFMWSPKGLPSLVDYYPGDDVVDMIGLSVFGLQKFDQDKFGRDRTFAELLKPGYDLVLPFNKPIYVAELGYVGNAAYVRDWASASLVRYPEFSKLVASVYFDDKEVAAWPEGYGLPDWRVTMNTLN